MTRLTVLIALLAASNSAAFSLPSHPTLFRSAIVRHATATEDTDFDAPIRKNPEPTVLDHDIVVIDDECYLGKYGQYEECVDFGKFCDVP